MSRELTKPQYIQLLADTHTEIGELQAQLGTERSQMVAALALLLAYQKVHDIASSWAECPCPLCGKVEGLKNKVGL